MGAMIESSLWVTQDDAIFVLAVEKINLTATPPTGQCLSVSAASPSCCSPETNGLISELVVRGDSATTGR